MNAKLPIALAAVLALFLSACSPTPENLIVGKWEVQNAPMKMTAEFGRDGTAKITMLGQTLHGSYKVNGGNELVWTMNGTTTTTTFTVTPTDLEITNESNQTVKYKRM